MNEQTELSGRGGCLTAILILIVIVNALVALAYLSNPPELQQTVPGLSDTMRIGLAMASIANVALAIAVWKWMKIGVFGLVGVAVLAFVLNLSMGLGIVQSAIGLLGPVILVLLVKPRWSNFR